MAHVGQELAFCAAGGFSGHFRPLKLVYCSTQLLSTRTNLVFQMLKVMFELLVTLFDGRQHVFKAFNQKTYFLIADRKRSQVIVRSVTKRPCTLCASKN